MRNTFKTKSGFTLIETLFYISLLGAIINSVVLLSSSYRSIKAVKDVESSALVVMNQIVKESHKAVSVDGVGTSYNTDDGSLILNTLDASNNPHKVRFYFSGGNVRKNTDESHDVSLTNEVVVQSIVFRPIQTGNSTGVKIELTIGNKHFYDTILF